MPNAAFVGRAVQVPQTYLVGREKIKEFALAIGERDSLCHDPEAARAAGYRDVVAPPTFTVAYMMPAVEVVLRDPDFGWDYSRMVHGDQSIVLHRPIVGGDELTLTVHVEDLAQRAGSHMLTLRCEVVDQDGDPVAETRLLLVTAADA